MSLTLADFCEDDSDSDDEEYIPPGGVISSDESGEEDNTKSRKRRGVPLGGGGEEEDLTQEEARAKKAEEEEKKKTEIDELWSSFKQDTASTHLQRPKGKESCGASEVAAVPPIKKVKIQETYDFAGENVTVEKEVDANSKEAQKFLELESGGIKEEKEKAAPEKIASEPRPPAVPVPLPRSGAKKSSGLSSVLSSIGKKTKMSTLEKSSLDWKKYKQDHRLEEELAHNSKDGYLEKQDFLHRSDLRQFELEKELRLKRFKKIM